MGVDRHNHVDENHTGECDICGVKMCDAQKQEGARNLMCGRKEGHKGEHYDRKAQTHF